jgi:hypothetical protein
VARREFWRATGSDRTRLGERVGALRPARLRLVLQGLALLLGTDELDTPEGLA